MCKCKKISVETADLSQQEPAIDSLSCSEVFYAVCLSHDSIGVNITAFRAGNSLLAEHYFYCFFIFNFTSLTLCMILILLPEMPSNINYTGKCKSMDRVQAKVRSGTEHRQR